ncbi:M13 family metallopeptidase [Enterococcus massiliensis]|uniref:M13 family metallopeptidase n=1 Tax=Enterococcus massiliensis TaxID=1640685 RepID=UPI00065E95B4|nr:M13-type metalloendopeptidase [Enterococcus massiliensis]
MTDLVKTDFYDHVNGEWVKTAEIPADKPATGGFQDLVQDIEQLLMAEFAEMAVGTKEIPAGRMKDAIEFYKLANDYETRNKLGVEPVKPLLAKVAALNSLEELNQQFPEWVLEGMPLPFALDVDQDMKDTQTNVVYAYPASTFLPDKTYYEENHPQGPELLKVFSEMTVSILEKFGKTNEEAAAIVADALAFDRSIVPHVRSSEENADYSKNYNPKSIAEFAAYSKELDLKKLVNDLVHDTPGEIIVTEPEYFAAFQQIVNPETFALMKNWLLVQVSLSYTSILSEDLRQLGSTYSRYLSGIDEAAPQQKAAYYLATNRFSQVVGDYYGKKYFGEKAKQDVEHMVEAMIAIYQNRLKNNTWLSENTREKAVVKLGTLGIQVGYPERIPELYDAFITKPAEDGGTLVENARFFSRLVREDNFSRFHKPVDRKEWEMSAATVNAYYHPFKNIIVFPAAILQAPFYSLEQSSSANYGGIGAVIAHEISHAFDNNGAKFDEFGNLNNWWTKEDLTHFEDLSKAMIAEFDGISFAGGKVNGTLTVSENIADAGGLSCALEAAKKEADVSLEDFFTNWAKIWRTKAREQYQQLLLSIDVHAPAKLRANVQVKNLDDFYTTFNITEEDAMYLSPEKRVHIW